MRTKRSIPRQKCAPSKGIAAVELAVCLPILMIVLFATIEACTMYYVQQSLRITAYEGARVGTTPTAQSTNVTFQCESLLDGYGINDYTITLDPAEPSALSSGDYFRVTVDANFGANSITGLFYDDKTLSRSVALRYE